MPYLIFAALAPAAFALLVAVTVMLWQRRAASGVSELIGTMTVGVVWLGCAFGELMAPSAAGSAAFLRWAYLAIPWGPVVWLAFALEFTGRPTWRRNPVVWATAAVALVTMALGLTLPHHDLLLTIERNVEVDAFRYNTVVFGPWFWVHVGVSWAAATGGAVLILLEFARSLRMYRRLSVWLALATAAPVVTNMVYAFGGHPAAKLFTPLSFAVSAFAFGVGMVRYRFLDLRPTVRSGLVESMSEGLVVLDGAGRVADFNAAFGQQTGLAPEPGDALPPGLRAVRQGASGEVTLGDRHFAWRAADVASGGGRMVLFLDVTERRAAETALRQTLDELHLRNEELDAYAHTVAHDLKNPLQAILGYAEMLHDPHPLPDDLRDRSVETILEMAQAMSSIIEELLLLARVRAEDVELDAVDTAAVVERALARLAVPMAASGAAVDVPTSWPVAVGYAPWVEDVWANYLSNAVKYGGRPPRVALGAAAEGDAVRFWVDDDGPGLSEAERAALFTPFTRLGAEAVEGHGLGLSIVRRIVEQLDGAAGVEPSPLGGCRFWFTLPAAPHDEPAPRAVQHARRPAETALS